MSKQADAPTRAEGSPVHVAIFRDGVFATTETWQSMTAALSFAAGVVRGARIAVPVGGRLVDVRSYVLAVDDEKAKMLREQPHDQVEAAKRSIRVPS